MKDLLNLMQLNRNEIQHILEVATQMRRIVLSDYKKGPQLIGHVVGGVWKKPCVQSAAFQLAAAYLSGTYVPVYATEDEYAICQSLLNMGVNTVAVSCDNDNIFNGLARGKAAVINCGSRQYDPIGVLADLMTLYVKLDGLNNLNVLGVGNLHVNKVNELSYCLQMFGSSFIWYLPCDDVATIRRGIVMDNPHGAFSGADAVIDLGLTSFSEAEKYYGSSGGITKKLIDLARINCPLLGSKNIVEGALLKPYEYSAADFRESCYVAVAMAVLYVLGRN